MGWFRKDKNVFVNAYQNIEGVKKRIEIFRSTVGFGRQEVVEYLSKSEFFNKTNWGLNQIYKVHTTYRIRITKGALNQ